MDESRTGPEDRLLRPRGGGAQPPSHPIGWGGGTGPAHGRLARAEDPAGAVLGGAVNAGAAQGARSGFGALAALLCAGLLASLAAPNTVQAQTTYVSNLSNATTSSQSLSTIRRAQTFTTGGTASDSHALGSVDILFARSSTSGTTRLDVEIWSTSGGDPDARLFDLTVPTMETASSTVVSFAAPENQTLDGGTTYAVVTSSNGYSGNVDRTTDFSEVGQTGWSIGDGYHVQNADTTWRTISSSFLIAVKGPAGTTTNNAATGQPGIDGTPQEGQTLTATAGDMADDDGLPTTTFPTGYSFQWVRVDSSNNETDLGTNQTYVPVAADVGNKIKVKVTFTDGGGTEETLESDETAAVVDELGPCLSTQDWCAVMTVGTATVLSVKHDGYDTGEVAGEFGSLDPRRISYGGRSYRVDTILYVDVATDYYEILLSAFLPRGSQFTVASKTIVANASSEESTEGHYTVNDSTNPGWIEGQQVRVSANLAPFVTAATVDGNTLSLTFAEDLDQNSIPFGSAFTVMVAGTAVTVSSVNISSDSEDVIELILASAVTSGQTVTVSYTPPSTDPLQDESGIAAPAFTNQAVTNNTGSTDSTDATLSDLELSWDDSGTETAITLSPAFSATTTAYTASVGNSVDEVTIDPTVNDDDATVAYFDGDDNALTDADSVADDFQVGLDVGENTIKVKVTAEDGNTTETYTLAVTRNEVITVGYDPVAYEVTEDGGSVTLTIKVTSHPTDGAPRAFSLFASSADGTAESPGDYAGVTHQRIPFNAGDVSKTHTIVITPDTDLEDDETFTSMLTLDSGNDVTISATTSTATVTIEGRDATGEPEIDGTPQVGQTLTAEIGDIADDDNLPANFPGDYDFQWLRVDGGTETDIGTNSHQYDPVAGDVGKTIRVQVDFTDGAGAEERLKSATSSAVVAAQGACPSGNDWCAEMTVGDLTTSVGFAAGGGALSDATIEHGDATYTVTALALLSGALQMEFTANAFLPDGSVLDVGGTEFAVDAISSSNSSGNFRSYSWGRPADFNWIVGQKVTVSANLAPIVTAARVDGDELVLTFAENLDTTSKPAASAFTVNVDGSGASPSSVDTISGNTVTMTLATAVTSGQTVTVDYTPPGSNPLQDESGIEAPAFTGQVVTNTTGVANTAATGQPGIDGTPQVGQTLTATAGDIADADNLPATTFPTGYSFQWVQVDGSIETNIGTNQMYDPGTADVGKTIKVKVTFTDGGGTAETLESATTSAVVAAQGACPANNDWCAEMTVGSGAVGSDTYFGFDTGSFGTYGALDVTAINYAGGYTVSRISYAEVSSSNDYFVHLNAFVPRGSTFDIGGQTVTANASSEITTTGWYEWRNTSTAAGWLVGQKVTVSANLAPIVTVARVDGDELVLTFAENLDTTSKPAASAFTVKVNGGTGASPSSVDTISGNTVTMTLATAVTSGQTVTVDYAVPTSNPLQDESGIKAPAFTGQAVTNNTGVANTPATGKPDITGAAQVGMTLTAAISSATTSITDADGTTKADDGESGYAYTYQWFRVDANGTSNKTEITGATSDTYTVPAASLGKRFIVEVSFTDDADNAEGPLPSDASSRVVPAAVSHCDAQTVWCATLTAETAPDSVGFESGEYGSIDNATFTHRGVSYTVTRFVGASPNSVHLVTNPNLPADGAGLTLHIQTVGGELSLPLADIVQESDGEWIFFSALELSTLEGKVFSDAPLLRARFNRLNAIQEPTDAGTEIGVRLSRAPSATNNPATGKPEITGTAEVGETLTAGIGDIADADGLPAFPGGFTFRWLRVDADGTSNRAVISGATARTYTLTAADEGRRIIVEASFTDDAGNAEGPLESDPYPSSGTVTVLDETAPSVISGRVRDDALTVVFDEDLAPAPNLANSAFTVTRVPEGGARETVSLRGSPSIDGAAVTLTLASAVESTDTDIQVGYQKPSSGTGNRLADAAGNEVASFSGQAVTLNVVTVSSWYVYFDRSAYTATEGGAGARVTVLLSAPWKPERNESLTVMLSDAELEGGATEADFSGLPESVTFPPGVTEASFTLRAEDDGADDDGESVRFGIAVRSYYEDGTTRFGVDAVSGDPEDLKDLKTGRGPSAVTVRLADDDGPKRVAVSFGARAYTAVEGGADATVAVLLDERPGRSVTIPLTTRHANAGDYSGVPESVTFGANETEKTFDVEAVDDTLDDDLSIVTLGFGELPAGVSAGSPAEAVVNLEDNDGSQEMVTLRFSAADTVKRELREGISFSLGATLEPAPNARVRIPLVVEYTGGATAADVRGLPATLAIGGSGRGNVIIRAVDDADVDPGEGFVVTFGELPAGVEADERFDEAEFTIIDNDQIPEINIADASVQEPAQNSYRYIKFKVSLSAEYDERVEVNYRTRNGTAKAGQDFVGTRGTLSFARRETTETVWVRVLGDDHNEGTETFTVELSDPVNATLGDHTAEGRINNTGTMPGAWLSRFGRAASDASIDAIGRRMNDGQRDSHLTLGGGGLNRLASWAGALGEGSADGLSPHAPFGQTTAWGPMSPHGGSANGPGGQANRHGPPAIGLGGPDGPGVAFDEPAESGSAAGDPFASGSAGGDWFESGSAGGEPADGGLEQGPPEGETLSGLDAFARLLGVPDPRELLRGASFFYTPRGAGPAWLGSWSAWGETSAQQFRGAEGTLDLNGELATATFGFDTQRDRWLAGLALSYTEGEGAYTRRGAGGALTSSLTSLSPYLRYALNERSDVWGVLGYGVGDLSLTPARAEAALEAGIRNAMAAFGGSTKLAVRSGDAGRFELALRSDARFTRTASDTVEGLMGAAGATGRVRVLLEGSGTLKLASGGVLKPTLEAALRYDGGDAETGAGLEVGGGLVYGAGRLKVRVDARALLAHEDADYREWGFSGSVAYTPDEQGRGLSLKLGSAWGATQSGVQALWSRETARGLARQAPMDAGQQFNADIGYGLPGRNGHTLWTPYVGAQVAGAGNRALRLGLMLSSGRDAEAALEIRQQDDDRGGTGYALNLGGSLRF